MILVRIHILFYPEFEKLVEYLRSGHGTKVVNLYLSRTHLYFGGGLKLENGQNKLVIVSSEVLPDIVLKVLAAKRMRARGEVSTSSEACRKVGISRSAYYKYKDSVFNYEEQLTNNIVSVYCILRDEKGVLSSIISRLYELNTNILTINQNIPIDSVATVTFSVRFEHDALSTNVLTEELSKVHGVVEVKIISGE